MLLSHLSIPLLFSLARAQSTTDSSSSTSLTSILFFDFTSTSPLLASVIAANPTAATLSIGGAKLTVAGASYDYLSSTSGTNIESIHCALTGAPGGQATTGTCSTTESMVRGVANIVNATVTSGDLTYYPVTITGGLQYLASASASASAGASSAASAGATVTTSGAASATTSGGSTASPSSAAVVGRSSIGYGGVAVVAGLLSWIVL